MGLRRAMILMALCLSPLPGAAEDGPVRLHVPAALAETGLLGHILPRFSLKTRVRVVLVDDPAQAQVLLGDNGRPVFDGPGGAWRMQLAPWTGRWDNEKRIWWPVALQPGTLGFNALSGCAQRVELTRSTR